MTTLRASVIIPTYNRATLVARAVESALRATAPGDEIIVADDGSMDGTLDALRPFGDRIRVLALPHAGAGVTRNQGVAAATRELVAFLDSDDEWRGDHLQLHKAVHAARPDIAFSFSDFSVQETDGTVLPHYLAEWHHDRRPWSQLLGPAAMISDVPVHTGDMRLLELQSDYIPTFTTVAKRGALPDSRWFAEDVPTFEDLQCFGRLAFAGDAAYVDRETATQHGHTAPRLTDLSVRQKVQARIDILERIWGADARFIAEHGAVYRERIREQQVLLARCLMKEGRMSDARALIRRAGRAPFFYRLLSWVPGALSPYVDKWMAIVSALDMWQ